MTAKVDPATVPAAGRPEDLTIRRFRVDLTALSVEFEEPRCRDLDDALGGIGRAMRLLDEHDVGDAYDPAAPLIVNLGALSGTALMTGLRTFVHGYSPLKVSRAGRPGAMWSAGSGKFGTKLRGLAIDEIIFTGRSPHPVLLHLSVSDTASGGVAFAFEDAGDLAGLSVNARIQQLHGRYASAHFAVIGPAGEAWRYCRFAALALSTENQLRSGDPKPGFCGRGGFGGVFGSKNLLGIAADGPDPDPAPRNETVTAVNKRIARGRGSARFREADDGSGGGTWANYAVLPQINALPERNFGPVANDASLPLVRETVEEGPFEVVAESCHRCGIRCHKNVHDQQEDGTRGRFRAKLDYEPLNLLSSNLGIYDADAACTLVQLVDELCMDSISLGATLSYAMEWNQRHPENPVADGLAFGDVDGVLRAIEGIARGLLPLLGQGVARLAAVTGDDGYAMHCKGVELPAYLPQTNPGRGSPLHSGQAAAASGVRASVRPTISQWKGGHRRTAQASSRWNSSPRRFDVRRLNRNSNSAR